MANASVVAELILRARDRTAQAFESVQRRLREVDRQVSRANGRFSSVDAAVGRASAAVAGFAAVGAGVGFAKIVGATKDFESALVGVQKKAGLTAAETARLGEEVKDLATSGELAVPISEILAGYERAGAAGIPLDEMKEFVKLTVMASDAFEMSAEASANAFLGFNKTLGLGFDSMERYADLINSLADAGIADESGIVNFIDRAGPSLKTFGMTLEQMAALGATAGNIKMGDDVAANALSTLTGKLLAPGSPKARAALAEIVGNVDEFQDLLKTDANKAFEEFLGHVRELDKFKGAELLTAFVGEGYNDEIQRFAAAYDEVISNRKLAESDAWYGSLTKAYQLKLGTLDAQWEMTKNHIEALSIDVGTMGLPAMKSGLEAARGVIDEIGEELKSFEAKIDMEEFNAAKAAVGELATEIGGLLSMGSDEDTIIGEFFHRLAVSTNAAAGSINTIKDALQAIGMVEQDEDTPEQRASRRGQLMEDYREINPVVDYIVKDGGAYDTWKGATDRTTGGAYSAWMGATQRSIDRLMGNPVTEDSGPSQPDLPEEPVWTQPQPIRIPDYSEPGSSGWSGGGFEEGRGVTSGPPGFTPGRGVTTGGPGEVAVEGVDELRAALEAGSRSVAQGGREAGAEIEGSAAGVALALAQSAAEIRSAGVSIAADIRGALAQGVKVTMPASRPLLPSEQGELASGRKGRSMAGAGTVGWNQR